MFDPVIINDDAGFDSQGVVTDRACLYSLQRLLDLEIRTGDMVNVESIGGGGVIPEVTDNYKGSKEEYVKIIARCPVCRSKLVEKTDTDGIKRLYCDNPLCEKKVLNRFKQFLWKEAVFIDGLSNDEEVLKSLVWNWYLINIPDLFTLFEKEEGLISDCGFSVERFNKLIENINSVVGSVPLRKLILGLVTPMLSLSAVDKLEAYIQEKNEPGVPFVNLTKEEMLTAGLRNWEADAVEKWLAVKENVDLFKELYLILTTGVVVK